MAASRTPDGSYVNARSEECSAESSAVATERDLRIVTYRGEEYVVVGMYFARGHKGRRELRYVLGPNRHTRETPGNA